MPEGEKSGLVQNYRTLILNVMDYYHCGALRYQSLHLLAVLPGDMMNMMKIFCLHFDLTDVGCMLLSCLKTFINPTLIL